MATVVIVEDEVNIQKFIATNLEVRGFEVIIVGSAEEGLHALQTHTADVVVLDVLLPGISGWDLLKQMQDDNRLAQIPVVVVTASAQAVPSASETYDNIAVTLTKPFSAADLVDAVERALAAGE